MLQGFVDQPVNMNDDMPGTHSQSDSQTSRQWIEPSTPNRIQNWLSRESDDMTPSQNLMEPPEDTPDSSTSGTTRRSSDFNDDEIDLHTKSQVMTLNLISFRIIDLVTEIIVTGTSADARDEVTAY